MSLSAIFIADKLGKPLIFRKYHQTVSLDEINQFTDFIQSEEHVSIPILFDEENSVHYIYTKDDDIYYVLISQSNSNAALCFEFLYRLISIFKEYFGLIDECCIVENSVLISEILDEIMDAGIIQTTDPRILKELAKPTSKLMSLLNLRSPIRRPPSCMTNSISWRSEGIQYKNNICHLDVIESNHVLIDSNGSVTHNFVTGKIFLNARLTGMPELMFIFTDKVKIVNQTKKENTSMTDVYLEDIRFHQCVSLPLFESEKVIKFIPPDGKCDLMNYRVSLNESKPPIEVCANYILNESALKISVQLRSNYKHMSTARLLEIELPVPSNVFNSQIRSSNGRGRYDPSKNIFVWNIRNVSFNRTYLFDAFTKLPTVDDDCCLKGLPPIVVRYEVANFALSGIQVRSLAVTDKSGYKAQSWIRYSTQNGEYHIRIN